MVTAYEGAKRACGPRPESSECYRAKTAEQIHKNQYPNVDINLVYLYVAHASAGDFINQKKAKEYKAQIDEAQSKFNILGLGGKPSTDASVRELQRTIIETADKNAGLNSAITRVTLSNESLRILAAANEWRKTAVNRKDRELLEIQKQIEQEKAKVKLFEITNPGLAERVRQNLNAVVQQYSQQVFQQRIDDAAEFQKRLEELRNKVKQQNDTQIFTAKEETEKRLREATKRLEEEKRIQEERFQAEQEKLKEKEAADKSILNEFSDSLNDILKGIGSIKSPDFSGVFENFGLLFLKAFNPTVEEEANRLIVKTLAYDEARKRIAASRDIEAVKIEAEQKAVAGK